MYIPSIGKAQVATAQSSRQLVFFPHHCRASGFSLESGPRWPLVTGLLPLLLLAAASPVPVTPPSGLQLSGASGAFMILTKQDHIVPVTHTTTASHARGGAQGLTPGMWPPVPTSAPAPKQGKQACVSSYSPFKSPGPQFHAFSSQSHPFQG